MANHEKDMYGHLIRVSDNDGAGGFGVSLAWATTTGSGRRRPYLTVFHESDGFQQSLFSVAIDSLDERPTISDVFEARLREVLDLVNQSR